MQTLYDSAGMAIVAYGEVLADGSSPNQNSGVLTARVGVGQYTITLPTNIVAGGAKNLAQSGARDSLMISPKVIPSIGIPVSHSVDDSDPAVKKVAIYGGSPLTTFADVAFNFIIFRTIVNPPALSPG
jgi:hypothetical protein